MTRLVDPDGLAVATIFQEAEGEPYQGKVAVGEVIRRRIDQRFFSDGTIEGTVLRPLQFSGWNGTAVNRIRSVRIDDSDPVVADCVKAWVESATSSLVPGAVSYYSVAITAPIWAASMRYLTQIGRHRFYCQPD
jgi:spore germination cell wall hydrolase CwlJ-like protein